MFHYHIFLQEGPPRVSNCNIIQRLIFIHDLSNHHFHKIFEYQVFRFNTLPETNSLHPKIGRNPQKGKWSPNHHFQGNPITKVSQQLLCFHRCHTSFHFHLPGEGCCCILGFDLHCLFQAYPDQDGHPSTNKEGSGGKCV